MALTVCLVMIGLMYNRASKYSAQAKALPREGASALGEVHLTRYLTVFSQP